MNDIFLARSGILHPLKAILQKIIKTLKGSKTMSGILVVTGASRGIGAATAILGAARGYRVAVNYNSSPERAEQVVAKIRQAGGTAEAIQADASPAAGHPKGSEALREGRQ